MTIVETKVYSFDDLDEQAQAEALLAYRHINVDWGWWESVYDGFKEVAGLLGVSVDLKRTYFKSPDGSECGSGYTASVNVLCMCQALLDQPWKEAMADLQLDFSVAAVDARLWRLIKGRIIDVWATIRPDSRETGIVVKFESRYASNECVNCDQIEKRLSDLEDIATQVCEELNHYLFSCLRTECAYQTRDTQVREAIYSSGINFLENGETFRG